MSPCVTDPVGSSNPLKQRSFRQIKNWEEWKARWDKAEGFEEAMGLLHALIEKDWTFEGYCQPITFLLQLADGYHDFRPHDCAGKLSQKAFAVLCLKFFRGGNECHYAPYWWWMLDHKELFDLVLWFLRSEGRWWSDINYQFEEKPKHPEDIFQEFVVSFAKIGWDFESQHHRNTNRLPSKDLRAQIVAARPRFIEMMHNMKILRWLIGKELDEASVQKLTALAMDNKYEFRYNEWRNPANLEEAVWAGSAAAQVLLLHDARQRAKARLDELLEIQARERKERLRQTELARLRAVEEEIKQERARLLGE